MSALFTPAVCLYLTLPVPPCTLTISNNLWRKYIMPINPNRAQDVWKDVGEHVQFTVLQLNRQDQQHDREVFQEFADRSQAIIRSL
ncbi:MAG: Dyp-type peroxidase, partial [Lactiplantibacillus plantarum]